MFILFCSSSWFSDFFCSILGIGESKQFSHVGEDFDDVVDETGLMMPIPFRGLDANFGFSCVIAGGVEAVSKITGERFVGDRSIKEVDLGVW
jgi:hypothetical protein